MVIESILLFTVILLISALVLNQHFPVQGICHVDIKKTNVDRNVTLLDVRDYIEASNNPVPNSVNIPYAYLKRYYQEVKSKNVVLIVSDPLLLNVSVRYLRNKHFKVIGYYLKDEEEHDSAKGALSKKQNCCNNI